MTTVLPRATLVELLSDPIALLLMRRDGVEPAEVWQLMADVQQRLKDQASPIPAEERVRPSLAA